MNFKLKKYKIYFTYVFYFDEVYIKMDADENSQADDGMIAYVQKNTSRTHLNSLKTLKVTGYPEFLNVKDITQHSIN